MSSKLSKEDQQLEDAGQFVISIFKGIGKGIKVLKKDPSKLIILIIITLICGVVFYLRENITAHFIPEEKGFHVLKIMLLLVPAIPFVAVYMIGAEEKESQDEYEKKFAEIGFSGKGKTYPRFLKKEINGEETIYSFYSVGLDLEEWDKMKSKLQQALDCTILKTVYAPKTRQVVMVHTVPSTRELEHDLKWDNQFIKDMDFVITVGRELLKEVTFNLNKVPHILLAGVTGGGKSVCLRCILWQCIRKGARIYMIDFKGGVEFGQQYEQFGEVITERQEALEMLKELTKENKLRLKLFRAAGVKNLAEYNEKFPDKSLCRIVLFCDEVAEMLDKTGLSNKEKGIFYEIEKEMSTLARLARAPGINMVLATQRPDANVLVGQIKNNLPIRISGRMVDDQASKMVLGNTEATKIGDTLGRFMYTIGADTFEFQAYNFQDSSLVKGDYQRGSMLLEDPDCDDIEMEEDNFAGMMDEDLPPENYEEDEFQGF